MQRPLILSGLLAYSVKVILCAKAASGQTPQLSRARESHWTAIWDIWAWKLSYFKTFWSPRLPGKSPEQYCRPINTIGNEWEKQGLCLWDLQSRKIRLQISLLQFWTFFDTSYHTDAHFSQRLFIGERQKTSSLLLTASSRCPRGIISIKAIFRSQGSLVSQGNDFKV